MVSINWDAKWTHLLGWWSRYLRYADYTHLLRTAGVPLRRRFIGRLGYPGATTAQLAATEQRLGVSLPPSYRAFLQQTNGWPITTLGTNSPLWSSSEIGWLTQKSPRLLEEAHNRVGQPQNYREPLMPELAPERHRVDLGHVQSALQISALSSDPLPSDGVQSNAQAPVYYQSLYLLNPSVITEEQEWEAWSFTMPFPGGRLPGAYRYGSFYEMIAHDWMDYPNLH